MCYLHLEICEPHGFHLTVGHEDICRGGGSYEGSSSGGRGGRRHRGSTCASIQSGKVGMGNKLWNTVNPGGLVRGKAGVKV